MALLVPTHLISSTADLPAWEGDGQSGWDLHRGHSWYRATVPTLTEKGGSRRNWRRVYEKGLVFGPVFLRYCTPSLTKVTR